MHSYFSYGTYYPSHTCPSLSKASVVSKNIRVNFLKCPSNSFDQNKSIYIISLLAEKDAIPCNFMYKLRVVQPHCTYPVSTYGSSMLMALWRWSLGGNWKLDTIFKIVPTKHSQLVEVYVGALEDNSKVTLFQ